MKIFSGAEIFFWGKAVRLEKFQAAVGQPLSCPL
jgi:hypothetical protein